MKGKTKLNRTPGKNGSKSTSPSDAENALDYEAMQASLDQAWQALMAEFAEYEMDMQAALAEFWRALQHQWEEIEKRYGRNS